MLAQRRNEFSPFTAEHFTILMTNNINYIYPVVPGENDDGTNHALVDANLFCEDESDGIGGFLSNEWGSDDISFNVTADGKLVVHADNDDDLEFDDDSQRDLTKWMTKLIRYVNEVEFELGESR